MRAEQYITNASRPVFLTATPADPDHVYIVEQHTGRIRRAARDSGTLPATPYLQLSGVTHGNEQGLLGLAFHPNFAQNQFLFVNFTDSTGATNIVRFRAASHDQADPASAQVVLKISQPFANHNGGWIGFGPDGFLYIGMGDGGSANDPGNRAQNLGTLLGKMLRIDVDGDDFPGDANRNYAIPADNPFVGQAGTQTEIWALGLRNPWRCSFDLTNGDFYIADVGQNAWEELNVHRAGDPPGGNYGWKLREGLVATSAAPPPQGAIDPVHVFENEGGSSIIGGYAYRGTQVPDLAGLYIFADYPGRIWTLRFDRDTRTVSDLSSREDELFPQGLPSAITSFGQDAHGELYICGQNGRIYKIIASHV